MHWLWRAVAALALGVGSAVPTYLGLCWAGSFTVYAEGVTFAVVFSIVPCAVSVTVFSLLTLFWGSRESDNETRCRKCGALNAGRGYEHAGTGQARGTEHSSERG